MKWHTYYVKVFEKMQKTHELISSLQYRRLVSNEAMVQTIDNQIVLENQKLEKLER